MVSPSLAVLVVLSTLLLARPSRSDDNGGFGALRKRIKTVVVLVEENRSHDTFFGAMTYNPNLEGLLHTPLCNPINLTNPSQGSLCASPTLGDLDPDDPNHGISGVNNQLFSTFHPSAEDQTIRSKQTMQGFLAEQESAHDTSNVTRAADALNFYDQNNIPVIRALAENFTVFSEWFCAVPGPTDPNRSYLTSGTSHGHGRNDADFVLSKLPQRSIFQQLSEANIDWINYSNTSGFLPDALFYSWTVSSGKAATAIKPISQFFIDAQAGTLPAFTYINPECCSFNSFHPPGRTSDGQIFVKRIYEALRSSPQWDEMLFILTFDEHGGFADHVPPPVNVPAGDNLTYTERSPDGLPMTFDFKRLGLRVPTFLISPFVAKGFVVPKPEGDHAFTHTSILSFLAKLWDLDFLTPRVEWSPTFEDFLLKKGRDDTPMTLPEPFIF